MFGGAPDTFKGVTMPWRRRVCAYLVVPFTCADDGLWVMEGETICFEHDLAMEIAEADGQVNAWVGVYALDHRGEPLTSGPIACYGIDGPPACMRHETVALITLPPAAEAHAGPPDASLH